MAYSPLYESPYTKNALDTFIGPALQPYGKQWFVDGDVTVSRHGRDWKHAKKTIAEAITAAAIGDTIFIAARKMAVTDTDPISYAEALTVSKPQLSLIGVSRGRTQGGLPQIKKGSGSAALLTIAAPGVLVAGLGFNGASATGGGILLDDDGGATKAAFGATIVGCHFKNCKGSTATDSRTGGAIQWAATGGAWQVLIARNRFYKNVGDIILKGTTGSVPQDVVIEDNSFGGPATSVDCHIYLAGGSGMSAVTVRRNEFSNVLPALASGSVVRYADLTGCTGSFHDNYFAGSYTTTGFGAAKAAAKIPTTVGLAHNYTDGGLIVREA